MIPTTPAGFDGGGPDPVRKMQDDITAQVRRRKLQSQKGKTMTSEDNRPLPERIEKVTVYGKEVSTMEEAIAAGVGHEIEKLDYKGIALDLARTNATRAETLDDAKQSIRLLVDQVIHMGNVGHQAYHTDSKVRWVECERPFCRDAAHLLASLSVGDGRDAVIVKLRRERDEARGDRSDLVCLLVDIHDGVAVYAEGPSPRCGCPSCFAADGHTGTCELDSGVALYTCLADGCTDTLDDPRSEFCPSHTDDIPY